MTQTNKRHFNHKQQESDLLSSLPDDLLHQILSKLPIKRAVQTCILSRRWTRVWATLSSLVFDCTISSRMTDFCKFVNKFLTKRNQRADISMLKLDVQGRIRPELVKRIVNYAVSHNTNEFIMNVPRLGCCILDCLFLCESLRRLNLHIVHGSYITPPAPWGLQYLTHLCLSSYTIPDVPQTFPVLTTLELSHCTGNNFMPWILPALRSLKLNRVVIEGQQSLDFVKYTNLESLELINLDIVGVCSIHSASLTNLKLLCYVTCKFEVLAPKLSCFEFRALSATLISAPDGFPGLDKVEIDVPELQAGIKTPLQQLTSMFLLCNQAKFLTLSKSIMMIISSATDLFKYKPSPFGFLKILKIKVNYGTFDSTFPSQAIHYLISSSLSARIVIEDCCGVKEYFPDGTLLTSQGWFGISSSMLDSKNTNLNDEKVETTISSNSRVLDEIHGAGDRVENQNSESVDELKAFAPDGICDLETSFELWHGHQVYPEFVDLLNHISEMYPKTFEDFSPQSEMFFTIGLNTLCSSVKTFVEVSMTKMTSSIITSYRRIFGDLMFWGFNIDWLVSYLDSFDGVCDTENHIQSSEMEVEQRSVPKMVEIQEALKELRTKLKASNHPAMLLPLR